MRLFDISQAGSELNRAQTNLRKSIEDIGETAINIRKQADTERALGMKEEEHALGMMKFPYELEKLKSEVKERKLKEAEAERKWNEESALVNVNETVKGTPTEVKNKINWIKSIADQYGWGKDVNGQYYVSLHTINFVEKMLKDNPSLHYGQINDRIRDYDTQISRIDSEINDLNQAGGKNNQNKIDELRKNRSNISQLRNEAALERIAMDNERASKQADKEIEARVELDKKRKESELGLGKSKIPIQSDKLQIAMAEIGLDPSQESSYTPENISKSAARLRSLEAQERRDRNEELTRGQRAMIAHSLRTELRQDKYVQDFKDISNKYNVMQSAYQKSRQPGNKSFVAIDQALITLYNKMTDPSSVVRESEYARTPENMSVVNRILGKIDKWRRGGAGLTSDERGALVEMATEFYNQYATNYDQVISDYEKTAELSEINPLEIGIPYRRKQVKKQSDSPPKITSDTDYNSLPSGSKYVAPDGSIRRKK